MSTLIVKHIPLVMSDDSIKEFFQHYGAVDIKIMQGKMKGSAYVTFRDSDEAKKGITQLHGLKFLDKTLSAEFSKEKSSEPGDESQLQTEHTPGKSNDDSEKGPLEPIAPSLGVNYPPNPFLEYRYPNPNPLILTNIVNAMTSRPKFYIQVLHLMNKMNLPPPFGPPAPSLPLDLKRKREDEEEEEEEEEEEDVEMKEPPKKQPLSGAAAFALQQQQLQQHIQQKLQTPSQPTPVPANVAQSIARDMAQMPGKKAPLQILRQEASKYISSDELERNRVSVAEIKQIDKKYEKGEPSNKLYIKNLAYKQVEIADLERIFGKYFPSEQAMKEGLEIKLMKEGRMKGQAFVTFQDEELAEEAMEEVNGFKLHDKPLIIQYGKKGASKDDQ